MSGLLVAITDRCTGPGCDIAGMHHPDCGVEPVGNLDETLSPSSMWDCSNVPCELAVWR